MRRLLFSTLIVAWFSLVGINSFAVQVIPRLFIPYTQDRKAITESELQTEQITPVEITADITGKLTAIKGDILSVKDKAGTTHLIMITDPDTLEQLDVGDDVNLKIEKGLVVSIEKTERKSTEFAPKSN
ncbi:MAG: hypothetical protein L0Y68_07850 [Candidatus Dadabacteria bacterium]|nr:hypothetical protein [Candidatus Dadabacteria bacterium]